jgi:hypothetical protein
MKSTNEKLRSESLPNYPTFGPHITHQSPSSRVARIIVNKLGWRDGLYTQLSSKINVKWEYRVGL